MTTVPPAITCPYCSADITDDVLTIAGKFLQRRRREKLIGVGNTARVGSVCPHCKHRLAEKFILSAQGTYAHSKIRNPRGAPRRPEVCPHCQQLIPGGKFKRHLSTCAQRPPDMVKTGRPGKETVCPFCGVVDSATNIKKHLPTCPNRAKCRYCHMAARKEEIERHEVICPAKLICRFSHFGCAFQGTKTELRLHESQCVGKRLAALEQHKGRVLGVIRTHEDEINKREEELKVIQREIEQWARK